MGEITREASTTVTDVETGDEVKRTAEVTISGVPDTLGDFIDYLDSEDTDGEQEAINRLRKTIERKLSQDIRRELQSGTDPEDVPAEFDEWSPVDTHRAKKSELQKALDSVENLSDDELDLLKSRL